MSGKWPCSLRDQMISPSTRTSKTPPVASGVRATEPISSANVGAFVSVARRVGELRFVTCAAPAYLARHGEPRHPLDLEKDHYVVSYFSTRTSKVFPLSFRSKDEEVDLVGRYAVSVNDGNAYLEAALVGMGVAQIPAFMAQQHLASGALRPVLTDWKTEPLPLHVVYPPNRHLSNKLRVFVDWIADLFAGHDLIQRSRTIGS